MSFADIKSITAFFHTGTVYFTINSQLNIALPPPPRCFNKSCTDRAAPSGSPGSPSGGFRGRWPRSSESFIGPGDCPGGAVFDVREARPLEQRNARGDDEEARQVCGVVGRVQTLLGVYDGDLSSGL